MQNDHRFGLKSQSERQTQQRGIQIERQTETERERDTDRQTDRLRRRETQRQTGRQADRQTEKLRQRETQRQTDTERQSQRDRETETESQTGTGYSSLGLQVVITLPQGQGRSLGDGVAEDDWLGQPDVVVVELPGVRHLVHLLHRPVRATLPPCSDTSHRYVTRTHGRHNNNNDHF